MNSMALKDKLKSLSIKTDVDFNTLLKYYVFDRFIYRMYKSKYNDFFVIKGGFLLSTFFGIKNRTTMDIDSAIRNTNFSVDNIYNIINEIINIDLNDNVCFKIEDVRQIRDEDKYGGYRFEIEFRLDNIIEHLKIDIATGDPITPSALRYNYKTMLNNENIKIWTYNMETTIAEKIETILSKKEYSSRMKDYYDIYLIYNFYWDSINNDNLIAAIKNTFKKREYNDDVFDSLKTIEKSIILRKRWNSYSKKNTYANNIKYDEIIRCISNILNVLYINL